MRKTSEIHFWRKIYNWFKNIEHMHSHIGELENCVQNQSNLLQEQSVLIQNQMNRIQEQQTRIEQLEVRSAETEAHLYDRGFERMLTDAIMLQKLNTQLSGQPIIWGDRRGLHISPLAAVSPCFFNTNSGKITVGDYTFAGSDVRILAGSHDMYLDGLTRRDAEIKQGCDIVIGKGVWLASGCTVLGPCTIGDNAVIAAGAVVTPGTVVPPNTVYAGVPARKIREIQSSHEITDTHIQDAVQRENGVLFVTGWSEKRQILSEGKEIQGHWLVAQEAQIYSDRSEIILFLHRESDAAAEIILEYDGKQEKVNLETKDKIVKISLNRTNSILSELKVFYNGKESEIFTAVKESMEN